MKIIKIFLSTIITFVLASSFNANAKENIAWGGSNPGGVMYYMVGAAGTIISEKLPQYNITQVTTGGSTENAKRLIKGELDMGIVYGAHVFLAQNQKALLKTVQKVLCYEELLKLTKDQLTL